MTQTNRRDFFKVGALAVGTATIPLAAQAQPAAAALPAPTPDEEREFIALSAVLTGIPAKDLPATVDQADETGAGLKLATAYWRRLNKSYEVEFRDLRALWDTVKNNSAPEQALAAKLAETTPAAQSLRLAARQVIKVWFLSTIDDRSKPLTPRGQNQGQVGGDLGQYQHSAIWKLIGAQVPGYSNVPHGYWAHRPSLPIA